MKAREVVRASRLRAVIYILFVVLLAVFATGMHAPTRAQAKSYSVKDVNVHYESVDKRIVVSQEKVCSITETITVTFERPNLNLGLRRNVSRWNKITRIVDGKKYVRKTLSKLTLQSVLMDGEPEYNFVEVSPDYFYINTGADNDYKVGRHVYEISYLYDMGEDYIGKFDDFTFDLMDYGFRGTVESFTATVTLPEAFDASRLTFRTNEMRPLGEQDVALEVDGNTLTCAYSGFAPENGLTMQLILPDGYFHTAVTFGAFYIVAFTVSVAAVVAFFVLWIVAKRPRGLVLTIEHYAPDGASPMEIAKIYRGRIVSKDFASLVLHWASLGLIEIRRKGKKHFSLRPLKEYPPIRADDQDSLAQRRKEQAYFNALFSNKHGGLREYRTDRVKRKDLPSGMRTAVEKLYNVKADNTKQVIFMRVVGHVLATLPLLFMVLWSASLNLNYAFLAIMLFPLIAVMVFVYVPIPIWFKCLWGSLFGGAPLAMLILDSWCAYDRLGLIAIAVAAFLICNYLASLIRPVDRKYIPMLGRILGFKRFLVTAELDKLEALVEETPDYFFDILPYCYVFGITEKMERKFRALNAPMPLAELSSSYGGLHRGLAHSMHSVSSSGRSSSGGRGGGGGGHGGSSGGGGGGGGCGGR